MFSKAPPPPPHDTSGGAGDFSAANSLIFQIPLPVIEIGRAKAETKTTEPEPETSFDFVSKTETPPISPRRNPQLVGAYNTGASPDTRNSTVIVGWNKALGQPRESLKKVEDRESVIRTDGELEERNRESDLDRDKHDSVYGAVWFATSGKPEETYSEIKEPENTSGASASRPLQLSVKREDPKSSSSSVSRESTVSWESFNIPEPTFTPPPLPLGTTMQSFTRAAIAHAAARNGSPPAVPPRPRSLCGNKPSAAAEVGDSSSSLGSQYVSVQSADTVSKETWDANASAIF